jgi:tetratricopeptide (TPR) repeat protein
MSTTVSTRKGIAKVFLAVIALGGVLLSVSPASAQGTPPELKSLIDAGRRQLNELHAADTDEAYQTAEATFDRAVQLDPKSGVALVYRGEARMERSGWLARQGRLDETSKVMADATADLDRAVQIAPEDFSVRALRGVSYAQFPPFLGKGPLAQADLEKAITLAAFSKQPGATRAQILYHLGRVYAAQPDSAKAQDCWKKAVTADPESLSGKAAAVELKKLTEPPQAFNPHGQASAGRAVGTH